MDGSRPSIANTTQDFQVEAKQALANFIAGLEAAGDIPDTISDTVAKLKDGLPDPKVPQEFSVDGAGAYFENMANKAVRSGVPDIIPQIIALKKALVHAHA